MGHAAILGVALVLDAAFGEPKWIWDRFAHPAVLLGRIIAACEARFNLGDHRRLKGTAVMAGLGAGAALLGWLIALVPDFGVLEVLVADRKSVV